MVELGNEKLSLEQFRLVVHGGEQVALRPEALQLVRDSFDFLTEFARNKVIYGINTGFGPMAQYRIDDDKGRELQLNLIRSHAAGAGKPLSDIDVRAMMLCRLNTLLLGYSGVHEDTVHSLVSFINAGVTPFIPQHGGVGASGDLVQLAHLGYTLIGEGEVMHNGARIPVREIAAEKQLRFVEIHIREGLAIMNGTAAMTGIGLNNVINAERQLKWGTLFSGVINEVMESYDDHVSEALNRAKMHRGQQVVAAAMRKLFVESKNIKQRQDILYQSSRGDKVFKEKVQEYYSLRCVPQIIGPILDATVQAKEVLLNEVNSANDNPIIDVAEKNVFHGGNFHGDYVAYEMDKLKTGITKLSMLAERQLNYLLNQKLNDKMPPFINLGELGFNFGLQGMQFTATSTTAENQMLSNPMYIHSIPNNNDNQDVVSMGTNAALATRRVIDNTYQVLAIEAIAIAQAIDSTQSLEKLSSTGRELYNLIREKVAVLKDDTEGYTAIASITAMLKENELIDLG